MLKLYSHKILVSIIYIILPALSCAAEHGLAVATGRGTSDIMPWRLSLQYDFGNIWETNCLNSVGGYLESNIYHLSGSANIDELQNTAHARSAQVITAGGVLRIAKQLQTKRVLPYLDLGLGVAYFSKQKLRGRDLGWRYQFEDRIGVGIRFGNGDKKNYDLGYKFVHFSNGYLRTDNHGINLHLLVLGYWY